MKKILLLLASASLLAGCSGFKPVQFEHDSDKEQLDYREGDWIPKNT
ncbi:hypothetical protein [Prosthecobacter sp.]|nr:hypothetical protein [Prosthecobacter sp.]MCB1275549.1 hypothetical protein [Prosthecobacter sp.]